MLTGASWARHYCAIMHTDPLSLYAEAAGQLAPELAEGSIHSGYLPLRDNHKEFLSEHSEEQRQALGRIVRYIMDSPRRGWVPTTADCNFCDYKDVCGRLRGPISERKLVGAASHEPLRDLARQSEEARKS